MFTFSFLGLKAPRAEQRKLLTALGLVPVWRGEELRFFPDRVRSDQAVR